MATVQPTEEIHFRQLLDEAVNKPGTLMKAYSAFWNYSTGNQLLAMLQLFAREIPIGPIASFMAWKDKGRFVKKGSKAISLCMPVTCKKTTETLDGEETSHFTRFIYKNNWFALAQTEGDEYEPDPIPGWDRAKALEALNVTDAPFETLNGNVQGYARDRQIAINPMAQMPA